jgi:hypothetical protein
VIPFPGRLDGRLDYRDYKIIDSQPDDDLHVNTNHTITTITMKEIEQ